MEHFVLAIEIICHKEQRPFTYMIFLKWKIAMENQSTRNCQLEMLEFTNENIETTEKLGFWDKKYSLFTH